MCGSLPSTGALETLLGLNTSPFGAPVVPAYGLNAAWASVGIQTSDALPDSGAQWPPSPFDVSQRQMHVWSSWWASDIAELQNIYIQRNRMRPTAFSGGLVGRLQRFFWGRPNLQSNPRIHVPAPADLSRTSADLLFGESWTLTPPDGASEKAGDRLQEVFGGDDTIATLLQAAEMASALGGVYLRLWWDLDIADRVMLDSIAADAAVPVWRYNQLAAVTFWRIITNADGTWVRHLEKHVPGAIMHGLYQGDQGHLGRQVPLQSAPETAWIAKSANKMNGLTGVFNTGVKALTAAYVPNMRPNRAWRNTPGLSQLGRSDYDGVEPLFDALDEAYSSWMRDIDLGKARLFVDESLLQSEGPGSGAVFDGEQEIFTTLRGGLGSLAAGVTSIQANQFNIRWQEHSQTCAEILNCILRAAGISSGSFSDTSLTVGVPTATEVRSRDTLSERTRNTKLKYWKSATAPLLLTGSQVDATLFNTGTALTDAPTIDFPTRSAQNPQELAQTMNLLQMAGAISTLQKVIRVNPDWQMDQVEAEVERIRQDAKASGFAFDNGEHPNPNQAAADNEADENTPADSDTDPASDDGADEPGKDQ